MGHKRELVKQFDKDGDGRLDATERAAARAFAKEQGQGRRGGRGPGGMGPMGREVKVEPGPKLSPQEVKNWPDRALYDPAAVRTFFLEFSDADWNAQLADFYRTDVEVPAKLTVDGVVYPDVGVHYRGNSSYFGVPEGEKKSLGLSLDAWHEDQRLQGYKKLNLLNCHEDPSFLHDVLHGEVARSWLAASRANLALVVINGEYWGVYANVQQFDKQFLKENFGTGNGARWRVPPNFGGAASLKDLGDDPARYRAVFQMKSGDDAAVQRLMHLCKVLTSTPADRLETELPQVLDVDGALRFLAIDLVLLDGDGYLSRASDYALYLDPEGRFHLIPYDSNEVLSGGGPPGGPGGPRGGPPGFGRPPDSGPGGPDDPPPPGNEGPGGRGRRMGRGGPEGGPPGGGRGPGGAMMQGLPVTSGPLTMADDPNRPLLGRLLSVPAWRARYFAYVRAIARDGLDWQRLGPFLHSMHDLVAADVERDTRKLYPTAQFTHSLDETAVAQGGRQPRTLASVVKQRRDVLLSHADLKGPWPEIVELATGLLTDAGGGASLRVTLKVADPSLVEHAYVHWTAERRGIYAPVELFDDGEHGDGKAGDGVYGGVLAGLPAGKTVRFYAEARAKTEASTTALLPASGEHAPRTFAVPKR
jgi:hypothetical protein